MTRKCMHCQADIIEGITPSSPGWCAAECDVVPVGGIVAPMIYYSGAMYVGKREYSIRLFTKPFPGTTPGTIPVQVVGGKEVGRYYDRTVYMDMVDIGPEEEGGTYYIEAL